MKPKELSKKIDAGIRKAVAGAIKHHKMLGQPIVISKGGKVVIVPAKQIKTAWTKPRIKSSPLKKSK